jgi:hypothetical protein
MLGYRVNMNFNHDEKGESGNKNSGKKKIGKLSFRACKMSLKMHFAI